MKTAEELAEFIDQSWSQGIRPLTLSLIKAFELGVREDEKTAKRGGKAKTLYSLSQAGEDGLNSLDQLRKQIAEKP